MPQGLGHDLLDAQAQGLGHSLRLSPQQILVVLAEEKGDYADATRLLDGVAVAFRQPGG